MHPENDKETVTLQVTVSWGLLDIFESERTCFDFRLVAADVIVALGQVYSFSQIEQGTNSLSLSVISLQSFSKNH